MDTLTLELTKDELTIMLKAVAAYPLAMQDPLYLAARNLYNKGVEGAKQKAAGEGKENKQ